MRCPSLLVPALALALLPTVRGKTYDLERDFGAVPYDPTQPKTAMNKTAVRS
eukprot:COSAG01_NODE_8526_length_2752_cov_29.698455_1_plen_52_part_00